MTVFTQDEVIKSAALANLPLADQDSEHLASAFSQTVDYIQVLDELDTSAVKPTFQVTGLKNVFQAPNIKTTLTQQEALQNAASTKEGKFVTNAVFER